MSISVTDDLDKMINSLLGRSGPAWFCKACGKETFNKSNIKNHVEAHHVESAGFACSQCSFVCKTRYSLYFHKKRIHEKKYKDTRRKKKKTLAEASELSAA